MIFLLTLIVFLLVFICWALINISEQIKNSTQVNIDIKWKLNDIGSDMYIIAKGTEHG
tara:strand:+ start:7445 stop:7618 length:174 start_codon:yes stop_codon:yes gene_type:complete